jgi:tetratricopeptide (TPR) repeat protein
MKLSRAGLVILVTIFVGATSGCSVINRIRSKNELNEAAKSYKSGKFLAAEQHAKRALELDPNSKIAPKFIARSIHAQYRPGIEEDGNKAIADRAIDAYKQILNTDPSDSEAYKAVVSLLKELNRDEEQRKFIQKKADDPGATATDRAEAFAILASQDWDCSYKITETTKKVTGSLVEYVKPTPPGDFETRFAAAKVCAARGMEEVENAIHWDPNSETAWSYKTNLLLERAKLAELDGNAGQKADFTKQADAARATTAELSRLAEAKKAAATPTPSPAK